MKKIVFIILVSLCFVYSGVHVFGIESIPTALFTIDSHGGTIKRFPDFDLTKSTAQVKTDQLTLAEFDTLDGVNGCYKISRLNAQHGSPYFMSSKYLIVKPNTHYYISALINCNFDRNDCEVNLGFYIKNANNEVTLIDGFHGVPAQTNGWQRFEAELTTPADAKYAYFYGMMAGFYTSDDGNFYISDVALTEMPSETLTPLGVGEGMVFGGSSGMYAMKITNVTENTNFISVSTNGAEYYFDLSSSKIIVNQRINTQRELTVLTFSKSISSLSVLSKSDNEVVLTTGTGGLTFGVQMDGLMLISTHDSDVTITATSQMAGKWNRLLTGNLIAMDDIGGFTVNPSIPMGTGRLPRYTKSTDVDFEKSIGNTTYISSAKSGWYVSWIISSGERLGITAFPPRKYDWANSFDSMYANFSRSSDLTRYQSYKNTYGVKYGVLWDFTQKAWGMSYGNTYTPKNEQEYVNHINAAKSAGVVPTAYMSMFFWYNRNLDEYINEVKRHRDVYGIEGVYTDGLPDKDWLVAYEGVRRLRELFPGGCIIAHTTGQSANGGPPLATPELLIPAIDAYTTFTLRGESVPGNDKNWNYPRFIASAYNTSNAFGILKGDGWTDSSGAILNQRDQYLLNLLYNGRARVASSASDLALYRGVLNTMQQNYNISSKSDDYYETCFAPFVRRLVRKYITEYPESVLLSETFEGEVLGSAPQKWTVSSANNAFVDNVETNQLLRLNDGNAQADCSFLPSYGTTNITYRFMCDDTIQSKQLITDSHGNIAIAISQCGGNVRYLGAKGGYRTVASYEAGQWYSVRIVSDAAEGKFDLYINDVVVLQGEPFYFSTAEQSNLTVSTNQDTVGTITIDDISVKAGL